MRAFIIRPFGTKQGIDFDSVARNLIDPALTKLGITGRETIEILKAGNIRIDMFQRLLTADLVVADVSIHNANVFYELGIRHALRDKRTFMIRCSGDNYPFDLQTDRYFVYDHADPARSLDQLIEALGQTLRSEDQDSPVFRSLPDLQAPDRSRFLPVPRDFREEVERAFANQWHGRLALLAIEVRGFEWESEGLRVVGRAQFNLEAHKDAQGTWEAVRRLDPQDLEANTLLGTIYQRLGDLTRSDQAIDRVLDRRGLSPYDRAEAHSLLGRNAKARWLADWEKETDLARRQTQALRSPWLQRAFESYAGAFREDLNHYYSGLNILAMLTVMIELVSMHPAIWDERFDTEEEAHRELTKLQKQANDLAAAVDLALHAEEGRLQREGGARYWADISKADLRCLTSRRPASIAAGYRTALAGAPAFAAASARIQLEVYQRLGILTDNVAAALAELPPAVPGESPPIQRVLLFTGHRIDAPGRSTLRFPPEKEHVAWAAIRESIEEVLARNGEVAFGLAGGASGGDILFHEVCAELNIPTRMYLALPKEAFIKASVADAGANWIERFLRLYDRLEVRVLAETEDEREALPRWLGDKPDYSIWQRNNLWLLYDAATAEDPKAERRVTLIALWDGEEGEGPGGTKDLVERVQERGMITEIIDSKQLFGLELAGSKIIC